LHDEGKAEAEVFQQSPDAEPLVGLEGKNLQKILAVYFYMTANQIFIVYAWQPWQPWQPNLPPNLPVDFLPSHNLHINSLSDWSWGNVPSCTLSSIT